MISKAGKWEDDATQYHPRQHTTPKSTAQDGLPGRVSDTAAAKPQAAINKGKELLAAWLLAVWLMALDRRTYTRWETQQSIWRWLRASPPETKTHGEANPTSCRMHLPLSACGIAVGRHWRTEGPDPLFKTSEIPAHSPELQQALEHSGGECPSQWYLERIVRSWGKGLQHCI